MLVATGYVVARRSSDVGVKTGGRLESLAFEEGTPLRAGQVIARIEHADLDAQLAASRAGSSRPKRSSRSRRRNTRKTCGSSNGSSSSPATASPPLRR